MECLGRYTFIVMTSVILSGGVKMRDERKHHVIMTSECPLALSSAGIPKLGRAVTRGSEHTGAVRRENSRLHTAIMSSDYINRHLDQGPSNS